MGATAYLPVVSPPASVKRREHKEKKKKEKKKPTLKLLNALYIVYIYIFIHVNLVYSILIVIFSVHVDCICRFFSYCDYYIVYVYVRLQS